jgi:tmRNA-binding protein
MKLLTNERKLEQLFKILKEHGFSFVPKKIEHKLLRLAREIFSLRSALEKVKRDKDYYKNALREAEDKFADLEYKMRGDGDG